MLLLFLGAVALNLYAAILVVLRAVVYRTRLYRPMLWNIVLSILPVLVLVGGMLVWVATAVVAPPLAIAALVVAGLAWLLALPNASYLITELNFSHRPQGEERVPLWYDIILVITLAMSGVVNTVLNVFLVHAFYAIVFMDDGRAFADARVLGAVGIVMLLLGFGMYLGRYLRLNSWDVKHPASFARKVIDHFRTGANVWACLGFTLTYALFLAIIYVVVAGPLIEGLIRLGDAVTVTG